MLRLASTKGRDMPCFSSTIYNYAHSHVFTSTFAIPTMHLIVNGTHSIELMHVKSAALQQRTANTAMVAPSIA